MSLVTKAQHQTSHLYCVTESLNTLPNICLEAVALAFQVSHPGCIQKRKGRDGEITQLARCSVCVAKPEDPESESPKPMQKQQGMVACVLSLPGRQRQEDSHMGLLASQPSLHGKFQRVRDSLKNRGGFIAARDVLWHTYKRVSVPAQTCMGTHT